MTGSTPLADRPIRWGIIGTGNIAHHFANGLKAVPDAELVAVGSRTQEKADAFGDEFGVARRYAAYVELAEDADLDAVYISTPHQDHRESTLLCLNAGRNVLCEKPFAINAGEARDMVAAARANNRFLMEAMWTRFRPTMVKLRELIAADAIGEPRFLSANIGWKSSFDPAVSPLQPGSGRRRAPRRRRLSRLLRLDGAWHAERDRQRRLARRNGRGRAGGDRIRLRLRRGRQHRGHDPGQPDQHRPDPRQRRAGSRCITIGTARRA